MNTQKFQNVSGDSRIGLKTILVLVILAFLAIGGVLIYQHIKETKERESQERLTPEIFPQELEKSSPAPEEPLKLEIGK